MVKLVDAPVQPRATGVIVTIADSAEEPAFVAVNEAIFPVPEALNPMDGLLLLQL